MITTLSMNNISLTTVNKIYLTENKRMFIHV